jgi:hypothetical protein
MVVAAQSTASRLPEKHLLLPSLFLEMTALATPIHPDPRRGVDRSLGRMLRRVTKAVLGRPRPM